VKGKIKYLSKVAGVNIYAGKKTNIVYLDPSRLNLAIASAKIQGLRRQRISVQFIASPLIADTFG
jgi:hypothetical protein